MRIEVTSLGLSLGRDDTERDAMAQEQGRRRYVDMPDGSTVKDLLEHIDGARQQVQEVLVNGHDATDEERLKDGDAVALVGPASGM